MHPKLMTSARYVPFWKELVTSSKFAVRLLAKLSERDGRTVMGRTLGTLCRQCGLDDMQLLTSNLVKSKTAYCRVPADEQWRTDITSELIRLRSDALSVRGFTSDELRDMLNYICTS